MELRLRSSCRACSAKKSACVILKHVSTLKPQDILRRWALSSPLPPIQLANTLNLDNTLRYLPPTVAAPHLQMKDQGIVDLVVAV